MKDKVCALVVHQREDRFGTLKLVLDALSIQTLRARNCKEAETALCKLPCPHLVLTDTVLPDGNWMDVLDVAAKAVQPANVIVVSLQPDIKLYLDSMDNGAFDFITDSFTVPEIVHVLKCAIANVSRRRETRTRSVGAAGADSLPISVP